jgi:hypothetical protein
LMGSASSMREKGVDVSSHQYSPEQRPPHQIPLVDSYGQMNQQSMLAAPAAPLLVPQVHFQPQSAQQTDSSTASDSRQNSVPGGQPVPAPGLTGPGGDVLMDDIDWVSKAIYLLITTSRLLTPLTERMGQILPCRNQYRRPQHPRFQFLRIHRRRFRHVKFTGNI